MTQKILWPNQFLFFFFLPSLCLLLLLINQAVSDATFPSTYQLTRNSVVFFNGQQFKETVYADPTKGIATKQTVILRDEIYDRYLYYLNTDRTNCYEVINDIAGEVFSPPLCLATPPHYPIPLLPTLTKKIGTGIAKGVAVDVYTGYDFGHWIYITNTTLGLVEPVAEAYSGGSGYDYVDVSLNKPSQSLWYLPTCYQLRPAVVGKRETSTLNIPSSFTLSFANGLTKFNVYMDATKNRVATYATFYGDDPVFVLAEITTTDKTYQFLNDPNVSPKPCSYAPTPSPPGPYFPAMTRLGSINYPVKGPADIYSDGSMFYFIQNDTTPIAIYIDLLYNINAFLPAVPLNSYFTPPDFCVTFDPAAVGTASPVVAAAAPSFPSAFTLYLTSFNNDKAVIYYNSALGLTRLDRFGTTTIQNRTTMYEFPTPNSVTTLLNPVPCQKYATSPNDPLFKVPTFTKFMVNATVSSRNARLWAATTTTFGTTNVEYWYLASTVDSSPLFRFGHDGYERIDYFQPTAPPIGVFDIPNDCYTVSTVTAVSPSKMMVDRHNIHKKHHTTTTKSLVDSLLNIHK